VGCPVIASITGVSLAVAVSEPTCSGLHDLRRIAQLTGHFGVPMAVIVNKWDINPEVTEETLAFCEAEGLHALGQIPYDETVTDAMVARKSIVEHGGEAARAVEVAWERIRDFLVSSAGAEAGALHGSR
jgi:MinD superfamily P-loop ATPase